MGIGLSPERAAWRCNLHTLSTGRGSLYTDAAHPIPGTQLGIAQAFLTYDFRPECLAGKLRVEVQGGAFWDRFGFVSRYDTYLFGRTHQIGEHVKLEFDATADLTLRLQHGFGAHLEDLDAGQGLTLLHHVMLGATFKAIELGFYDDRALPPAEPATFADRDVVKLQAQLSF